MGQLDEEGAPPRDEGTPPIMDEHDPTTYEDPTTYDEDVEEDAPVQPVQSKGIERVRKMVPLGTPKEKKVVPPSSPLVPLGTPKGGAPSGAPKGGDPSGIPKKVRARLADALGIHANSVREMVRWARVQPEVIQYLRDNYAEDDLPPWVGQLHEVTDTTTDDEDDGTTTDEEDDDTTTTDEEDEDTTTMDEEDSTEDEDDTPVQPVQAKGIERVQKMVVGHGATKRKVVVPSGGVVVGHGTKSGGTGGGTGGVPPKKAEKKPKATPPTEKSNAPPKENGAPPKQVKVVPKPLVEVERKPTPRVKEVITPAQTELVDEPLRMQEHDPDVVPTQGGGYGRIVRNRAGQLTGVEPVANVAPELRTHRNFPARLVAINSLKSQKLDCTLYAIIIIIEYNLNSISTTGSVLETSMKN